MIRATISGLAPRSLALTAAFALPILAGGCSTANNYPSLALRDFERAGQIQPVEGEPAPTPPAPALDADLATKLASLVAVARAANERFEANRPGAEKAAAAAGSATSDSWSSAQVALSGLQASRSSAMVALADLDRLYVDARDAAPLDESPNARAIATARGEVGAWVARQDKVIAAISARLGS